MKIDNILYRGKTKATNEWAFGDAFINGLDDVAIRAKYIYPSGNPTNRSKIEHLTPYEVLRVDPSSLDLYSGLNDKNGSKIFDGDIVRVKYEGKTYVGTISNDSYAVFGFVARSFGWIPLHDLITDSDIEKILVGNALCIGAVEVIGNITDDNVDDFTGGKK